MDGARFDRLARTLHSRRTALGGLLGGNLVLLGLAAPEAAEAHTIRPLARCRRIQSAPGRRACLRRARAHNRSCHPQTEATTCAGRCGVYPNNCGTAVGCPCLAGKDCLSNGSCAQACTDDTQCPTNCVCSYASTGGSGYCLSLTGQCSGPSDTCASTATCPPGSHCVTVSCGAGGSKVKQCMPHC
jgi:hypothetical protein